MEALWKLEDKCKLSTQEAVIFFAGTAFLVVAAVGLCAATTFRKRDAKNSQDGGGVVEPVAAKGSPGQWLRVKKGFTGSVQWSKASKWDGNLSASRKEQPTPLLARGDGEVEWPSHNAGSPVWHRPILMGEKCEFPRFSGLILYDERGKPLDQGNSADIQEQPTERATLRDLL
ncbi:hypothetical protein L1987_19228 [Smallanthus sonchifolius]|uniref:Uncharacterized protein n=1 Tax=Smallanthus sonchifolius TaxID=185202 RepID=A0ACB9INH8_9ASTR|nr:hypothetical protein L1987_19228 [Smallanthus sonchifolius]